MIAVDTNIVLRLILADDAAQLAVMEDLIVRETLFVPLTVLLETGWVLESRYCMSRKVVADALRDLATLDRIVVPRSELVIWAIERYQLGADLADMIHVVAGVKTACFATLDHKVKRRAGDAPPVAIETLR